MLLGMKKRGFGSGKWNGFGMFDFVFVFVCCRVTWQSFQGGKIEPGETILDAAIREMEEESGIAIPPTLVQYSGNRIDGDGIVFMWAT